MSARLDIQRKIAALEAKAASTIFPAERETCLVLAAKLRAKRFEGTVLDEKSGAIDRIMDAALWAEAALRAVPGMGGRDDMWAVPGHGPAVDFRGLVEIAIERAAIPQDEQLQAAMIRTMGWRA